MPSRFHRQPKPRSPGLRSELTREEERLQHRRTELDGRVDRLEQREQAVNKRQSAVDRRANEVEKLHQTQMEEVQRVAQMNVEEARASPLG
jgi:ribonuclease Y